jgi:hypothetical protein
VDVTSELRNKFLGILAKEADVVERLSEGEDRKLRRSRIVGKIDLAYELDLISTEDHRNLFGAVDKSLSRTIANLIG